MPSASCKNYNSDFLHFPIMSPDNEFISFLACNLVINLNELKIFGKIIEWVKAAAACWNDNSVYL